MSRNRDYSYDAASGDNAVKWVLGADGRKRFLVPIARLRDHFEVATNALVNQQRHGRAPGDGVWMKLAAKFWGAVKKPDGESWVWKDNGRCLAVLPREDILAGLARMGIKVDRTDEDADASD